MADVSNTERGQLILITGLAIAVTLVALVLLMNTVIFTENLATRGAAVGGQDVVEYQGTLVEGVGGVIDEENQAEHEKQALVEENVTAGISQLDELVTHQYVRRGTIATMDASTISYTEGRLVRHTDGTAFDAPSGDRNWTVAEDVPASRQFRMTVDGTTLSQTTDPESGFHVSLKDTTTGNTWRAYLYNDSNNDVAVAVKNGTESIPTKVCSISRRNVTVDFTAGTVGGEECSGLQWAKGVENQYTINYTYGDRAQGTYNITVRSDGVTFPALGLGSNSGTPYSVHAVYSATFEFRYETADLAYSNEIRTAPGEPA